MVMGSSQQGHEPPGPSLVQEGVAVGAALLAAVAGVSQGTVCDTLDTIWNFIST